MTVSPGHATGSVRRDARPARPPASAVTILNVEPGGKRPVSASAPAASAAPFWATASSCRSTAAPRPASPAAGSARRRPRPPSGRRGPARSRPSSRVSGPPRRAWRPCRPRRRPPRPTSRARRRAAAASAVRTAGRTWRANPRIRGQQPLGGGEPHAGQVVDRVLHRPVVRVPQDGDGVGAAVRGARGAVRDRLRGDGRLDRRQRGGQRARHAGEVAGLQAVEQHRDDGCRGEQRHTRPVDDRSGFGGAGVQDAAAGGRRAAGARRSAPSEIRHAGPSPVARRRPVSPW